MWYYSQPADIKPTIISNGNVGQTDATTAIAYPTSSHVYTATIDYTLPIREAASFVDNVSGSQTYLFSANNSGSFDAYKLSIGGPIKDGKWVSGQGYIGAVLLYNNVLTDSERTQVYNYLSSSYL